MSINLSYRSTHKLVAVLAAAIASFATTYSPIVFSNPIGSPTIREIPEKTRNLLQIHLSSLALNENGDPVTDGYTLIEPEETPTEALEVIGSTYLVEQTAIDNTEGWIKGEQYIAQHLNHIDLIEGQDTTQPPWMTENPNRLEIDPNLNSYLNLLFFNLSSGNSQDTRKPNHIHEFIKNSKDLFRSKGYTIPYWGIKRYENNQKYGDMYRQRPPYEDLRNDFDKSVFSVVFSPSVDGLKLVQLEQGIYPIISFESRYRKRDRSYIKVSPSRNFCSLEDSFHRIRTMDGKFHIINIGKANGPSYLSGSNIFNPLRGKASCCVGKQMPIVIMLFDINRELVIYVLDNTIAKSVVLASP